MDLEEELTEIGKKVAGLEADVENLNGWQKSQNGALLRVDGKVDKLIVEVTKAKILSAVLNIISPITVGLIVYFLTKG